MVCGMTTSRQPRTRPTPAALAGALLAVIGVVMAVGTLLAMAQDTGNGFVLVAGSVLLVGGLLLNYLAPRRQ